MPRIRYVSHLTDVDRIRVDFKTELGRVKTLNVVQYETMRQGKWHPVARYDTTHGSVHLDLQTPAGSRKYRIALQNLDDALTFAIEDLKANWSIYKKQFLGEDA